MRRKVQLFDATAFWTPLRKSLGAKRREIPFEKKEDILWLLADFEDRATRKIRQDGEEREVVVSHVYPTTHFGFREITVERPLRLDSQANAERLARLEDERAFKNLAVSRKKGAARVKDEESGREGGVKLAAPIKKAILSALSERNPEAEVCRDKDGNPEPDPELRDTESVPLSDSVEAFFDREVRPHFPDAWIDSQRRDAQDGEVGIVGYEINFNRYFYQYRPPRPLEAIEKDIREVEKDIMAMLRDVAG